MNLRLCVWDPNTSRPIKVETNSSIIETWTMSPGHFRWQPIGVLRLFVWPFSWSWRLQAKKLSVDFGPFPAFFFSALYVLSCLLWMLAALFCFCRLYTLSLPPHIRSICNEIIFISFGKKGCPDHLK